MTHPEVIEVTQRIATRSAEQRRRYLERMAAAAENGSLERDFIAVLRYQGPQGLGMPELHKLTPALGVLQDRRHRVALVTDGRMSGASGKTSTAIHLTPEGAAHGPLTRVADGDVINARRRRHLKTPNVGCLGGSWLTPTDAIDRRDWSQISTLASVDVELAEPTKVQ
jgi:hypothetical protein